MTVAIAPSPKSASLDVQAPLLFLERAQQKPFVRFSYDAGDSQTNATYAPRLVSIRDARPLAPSIDVQGFELARWPSAISLRPEERLLQSVGHAEAADLVSQVTGSTRVHVFDHTLRRAAPDAPRQPSTRVHNDYTAASAVQRVRDLLGGEADALLRRPFAFINVWRPVRRPAVDWPLALCDARSVGPDDLVATDIVYPDRRGEIYGATHAPQQRWFYFPEMQLDEALLIKCYDTRPGVARFVPHTAFRNPLAPPGAPPRESVEFRTMAFFD